ncbi:RNA polymerase transcriptional regulation mediator-related isoform 1 [Hibiscus syriacus]|uniref:Inositol oxygenase n=1 Tax=Hibiscus syriacus TaxID=106335 RepID=A0A6A3A8Z8_HIBSY|nr:RNA polymerase transcriptional regulation mediator-related isoform 1 [Hibiscus syriacus]
MILTGFVISIQVAKENNTTLPPAALFIIRYHSFYALHKSGAYKRVMNEEDAENLKWLHIFNKYDLYSQSKVQVDVEKLQAYYMDCRVQPANVKHPCKMFAGWVSELSIL